MLTPKNARGRPVTKLCLALETFRRTEEGRARDAKAFLDYFFPQNGSTDRLFIHIPKEIRADLLSNWGIRGKKSALRDSDEKVRATIRDALGAGDIDATVIEEGVTPELLIDWVALEDWWSFWRGSSLPATSARKALAVARNLALFDERWFFKQVALPDRNLTGIEVVCAGLARDQIAEWIRAVHVTGDASPEGLVASIGWETIFAKTAPDALVVVLDALARRIRLVYDPSAPPDEPYEPEPVPADAPLAPTVLEPQPVAAVELELELELELEEKTTSIEAKSPEPKPAFPPPTPIASTPPTPFAAKPPAMLSTPPKLTPVAATPSKPPPFASTPPKPPPFASAPPKPPPVPSTPPKPSPFASTPPGPMPVAKPVVVESPKEPTASPSTPPRSSPTPVGVKPPPRQMQIVDMLPSVIIEPDPPPPPSSTGPAPEVHLSGVIIEPDPFASPPEPISTRPDARTLFGVPGPQPPPPPPAPPASAAPMRPPATTLSGVGAAQPASVDSVTAQVAIPNFEMPGDPPWAPPLAEPGDMGWDLVYGIKRPMATRVQPKYNFDDDDEPTSELGLPEHRRR